MVVTAPVQQNNESIAVPEQHRMSCYDKPSPQSQPERPIPISQRAKSNVETKAAARRGLLNIMMNKFSSTPLQEIDDSTTTTTTHDSISRMKKHIKNDSCGTYTSNPIDLLQYDASLTKSEREYLKHIILVGDTNSIQSASVVLQNEDVFPTIEQQQQIIAAAVSNSSSSSTCSNHQFINNSNDNDSCIDNRSVIDNDDDTVTISSFVDDHYKDEKKHDDGSCMGDNLSPKMSALPSTRTTSPIAGTSYRDSNIQQQLFRLHETNSKRNIMKPTEFNNIDYHNKLDSQQKMQSEASKIRLYDSSTNDNEDVVVSPSELQKSITTPMTPMIQVADTYQVGWSPFDDISSWLDGSQGVEVTAATNAASKMDDDERNRVLEPGMDRMSNSATTTSLSYVQPQPFLILGTSADDVSCHPHVLSPPLMESLLAFVPEIHLYPPNHQYHRQYALPSQLQQEATSHQPINDNKSQSCHFQSTMNDDSTNSTLDCQKFTCHIDTTSAGFKDPDSTDEQRKKELLEEQQLKTSLATSHSMQSPSSMSYNFWLKYSLVRDGPGLWTFLRQVRASALCILAIETTDGHVFGAYTSQPWRLSKGWYGNKDTFLWKMRRSRLETAGKTLLQQICQESEIQVYPYRTGNVAVQYCSQKCLMLGQGEVIPSPKKHNPDKPRPSNVGKHYGYAIYLDKDLTSGTTSSSETFGNPCLLDPTQRGAKFTVANIELWTLTPHTNVTDAEQSELSNLFLDGGRDGAHRLNFLNILVGGPI